MSVLSDYTFQEWETVRRALSYVPPGSYFSGRPATRKYLISKRGEFPTGLFSHLKTVLPGNTVVSDKRTRVVSFSKLFTLRNAPAPYPEQLAMVDAVEKFHRGTISAVTGFGKSVVIALIIARLQVRTLIIVPNLQLKQQLTYTLVNFFGVMKNITVENIDSGKLPNAKDYDLLIIDEAHHVAAATYRKLNQKAWNGIYYRVCLTATPYRNQAEEQLLFESIAGQVIYTVDYATAVQKGYIVPVEAYYYDVPVQKTEAYTWAQVYSELVVSNSVRNDLVAGLLQNLKGKASTLCLVKEIAHGEALSALTGIPFASGQNEDCQTLIADFNSKAAGSLIATSGVAGEGIDTKACEYVVIAGLGRSKLAFCQQVGRGVRKYPGKESCKVILFRDISHKFCKKHFAEQKKFLLDVYGVVPVKLG